MKNTDEVSTNQPVQDKQDVQVGSFRPWIIWLIATSFFFYEFLLQVFPNVVNTELMQTFKIGAAALGGVQTFYFLGYASMQIPGGMLLDRFGPRRLLTLATLLCAVGAIMFAESSTLHQAEITRFITGLGSAFALVGALVLTSRWFPPNRFAFMNGLIIAVGMLGAVVGEAPLAILVERYHWQHTIIILGFIGIGLAVLIYFVVRSHPKRAKKQKNISIRSTFAGLKKIVACRQSWVTATYGTLMYAPTAALGTLWGVSFLTATHHLNRTDAAGIISVIFLGWVVGSPTFGGLSDRMGRRKPVMYIGSVGAFIFSLLMIYHTNTSHIMLSIYIFFFGFFSSGFVIAFSVIKESHSQNYSGTSLGFMNMVNSLGASIAPFLIGMLLDHFWDGAIINNVHIFSANDFFKSMSVIPLFIACAFVLLPFIKETYCKVR